ncbi:hypothetical protein F5141DRAFT_1060209 [Pisolithus sp. B1]|nr:hypothetical protein F5141DRAFT_1060209 [Pisolithus sp. B1]
MKKSAVYQILRSISSDQQLSGPWQPVNFYEATNQITPLVYMVCQAYILPQAKLMIAHESPTYYFIGINSREIGWDLIDVWAHELPPIIAPRRVTVTCPMVGLPGAHCLEVVRAVPSFLPNVVLIFPESQWIIDPFRSVFESGGRPERAVVTPRIPQSQASEGLSISCCQGAVVHEAFRTNRNFGNKEQLCDVTVSRPNSLDHAPTILRNTVHPVACHLFHVTYVDKQRVPTGEHVI